MLYYMVSQWVKDNSNVILTTMLAGKLPKSQMWRYERKKSDQQKSYYTHQNNTVAHHYVCADVLYDYWLNALLHLSQQYRHLPIHVMCYHVTP